MPLLTVTVVHVRRGEIPFIAVAAAFVAWGRFGPYVFWIEEEP